MRQRVAIVGTGVSGLVAAHSLHEKGFDVHMFEKESHVGGHAWTQRVAPDDVEVDVGFMVLNHCTYPNLLALFEKLGVQVAGTNMSLAVEVPGLIEWGTDSMQAVLADKYNLLRPDFYRLFYDLHRFQADVNAFLERAAADQNSSRDATLGDFLQQEAYSRIFLEGYLLPMCASIWSTAARDALQFPAFSILTFMRNHHLLQIVGRPQWLTLANRSRSYVDAIIAPFRQSVRTNAPVFRVEDLSRSRDASNGPSIVDQNQPRLRVHLQSGEAIDFHHVVMATHAPDTLRLLGDTAGAELKTLLACFEYQSNDIWLHRDAALLPSNRKLWSSWNFMSSAASQAEEKSVYCSYYINKLQHVDEPSEQLREGGPRPLVVTLNPPHPPAPDLLISHWETSHPKLTVASYRAQSCMDRVQGQSNIWLAGAYMGWGFHEDGAKAGLHVAGLLSQRPWTALPNLPSFSSLMSWTAFGARQLVLRVFGSFPEDDHLELRELGGQCMLLGSGGERKAERAVLLEITHPDFYTLLAAQGPMGFAEAWTAGHVKGELVRFLQLCFRNRDRFPTGMFSIAGFAQLLSSAHQSDTSPRERVKIPSETRTQIFSACLDRNMQLSGAFFQQPDSTLEDAQVSKMEQLCQKAQVEARHTVLNMSSGWGGLAIYLARTRGCSVVGLVATASEKAYAEQQAHGAGLAGLVRFEISDIAAFAGKTQAGSFDRVIGCEALQAIDEGEHESCFASIERLLRPQGLVVLQAVVLQDQVSKQYLKGLDAGFELVISSRGITTLETMTENLTRSTTMTMQDAQELPMHYGRTVQLLRQRFLAQADKLDRLGVDVQSRRGLDYCFQYWQAGFESNVLRLYQLVMGRSAAKQPAQLHAQSN